MYISSASVLATITSLALLGSAANIDRSEIEARNNLAAAKAVLVALKASAFCSSFVPIKDVTSTISQTGPTSSTEVTETAACTTEYKKVKRLVTSTASSTTPAKTPSAISSKCSIKGVQPQIAIFGCQVIKEACTAFVKPKTVKTTVAVPGTTSTGTVTVTPTCSTTPAPQSPKCNDEQSAACSGCGVCGIDTALNPLCYNEIPCTPCETNSDCAQYLNGYCTYTDFCDFLGVRGKACAIQRQDCQVS